MYHVNPETGNVGRCNASQGNCPFADAANHYSSPEAARAAFEVLMDSPFAHPARDLVKKTLESLGVDPAIAAEAEDDGVVASAGAVEAELRKLPIYLNGVSNVGDRVRVTRRVYSETGKLESTKISTGLWQEDEALSRKPERRSSTGRAFVRSDGVGFDPTSYRTARELERASLEYLGTFRARTEGAVGFGRGDGGVYFEHDSIEIVARAGEFNEADTEATYERVQAKLRELRQEEKRASRPRIFRRG